ncbi:MAG: hypothetical protein Q8878_01715, partial [Bacillota bacterium]|nr:hypothetical protein [Bacillota bacterium]
EAGVHPDIIKLGAEQELKVDEVRELRRNAYIRPNEADVKVFIVYNCDKMNLNAQNAMLNILEEPPRGVFFLLVCENRALLLPTVLSRCAVYRMPPQELTDAEDDERVSGFIKALCSKSEFQFLSYCMTLEKLKREEFSKFLELLSKTVCEASIKRNGGQTEKLLAECFSTEGLCGLYSLLEELSDRIKFNASNAALISALLSGVSRIKRELQKNGGNVFD